MFLTEPSISSEMINYLLFLNLTRYLIRLSTVIAQNWMQSNHI